ncbi:glycoside hydrolase [Winogradskyella thalassocola]|nr:glycoside hydrolase [Winogradskyella thalassocola]
MMKLIIVMQFAFASFSQAQTLSISINEQKTYQQIEGFGASDAWRCQFVGLNWPDKKRDRIAELLFSNELDDNGNPLGIGLSFWRFYIGAGTTEQGENSDINNEWRRGESFIDSEGNYDWTKQKGQQWFLNKAKDYGVENFLAFSISAPVHWTKNGKGYNGDNKDGEINLRADKFDEYSEFMVEVLKHFKSKGIDFNYLSPINEPQWDWETKTQEGTPATNNNILDLTELLDRDIEKNGLSTEIIIAEAADLRWLYSDHGKSNRGNQIDYFFNNDVSFQNLKNTISGHSYFTTWPVDSLISIRQQLNKKLDQKNLNYWQSEFCILEKTDDIGGGRKRDLGMDTALYVARVLHADLTLANASSWQWWTALTNADFKDGLIYLDTGNENDLFNLNAMITDGDFHDSKLLWAFGNYSRFIKPNMLRIDIKDDSGKSVAEQYTDVMLSAYLDVETNKIAIVAINYSNENRNLDFSDFNIDKVYVTSDTKNLESKSINNSKITLTGRSVNTLIGF